MDKELLYCIPAGQYGKEGVLSLLAQHPEIRFVSLVGIDLAGNDTDEKIPIEIFMKDYEDFFAGKAVQTDGSSVVFMNIATLNDARVDMVADSSVNWYVDYNDENIEDNGKPVGTLRIPCFLIHNGKFIDSRSILKNSCEYVAGELKKLLLDAQVKDMENFPFSEIQDIVFTTGTELEFWVKTPSEKETVQHLSISQRLQEQYWQRMRGNVRTAMEQTIEELDARGLHVEMGHKEVGGIKPKVDDEGHIFDVCEQLELDWLFSTNPLQAADNELEARIVVREVFRRNGLDVSFRAKPIIGVAGSGEHTHVGIAALLKNGKTINLLAPEDMKADFLSTIGYGFIMGILNNYEATNPFVSSTTDAFNRLKPGFEAPVCIVTSLGHTPEVPSRNRSILMGLIRDIGNPKATRFELRAPNPFTNTYLAVSCLYLTALDGIEYALKSNKSAAELLAELSKKPGEDADYLEKGRAYRCEENVFEAFTDEERDAAFGKPPATVWENVKIMKANPDKVKVITKGDILSEQIVDSFLASIVYRWKNELIDRIIPGTEAAVRGYKKLDNDDKIDERRWKAIKAKRIELAKDTDDEKCICTRLKDALESGDYDTASDLQLEMTKKAQALEQEYHVYALNILD
ncbi:glutamine synthetase [uncultured Dialister sp.]|jgi:glutamine synthetase|uniref:glutamine synthetase n=1 Tax=uncultured Dialister sp. TaxID=278064 RepID=UPI0025CBD89E|nr:glutamine synthetase [uncultured Dialister sp.]